MLAYLGGLCSLKVQIHVLNRCSTYDGLQAMFHNLHYGEFDSYSQIPTSGIFQEYCKLESSGDLSRSWVPVPKSQIPTSKSQGASLI
jgi:hypothetical protein